MIKQERRASVIGLSLLAAAYGTVLLCVSVAGLLHKPPNADHCAANTFGQATPTSVADGTLKKAGDFYYVHNDGSDDVFVAACIRNKGDAECHGPVAFVQGHVNESVHVEFCGKSVTRLILSGHEVSFSLPTQSALNASDAKKNRLIG